MATEITKAQAIRELARRHLLDFCILMEKQLIGVPFDINWHHEEIAKKLEQVERGECKRLIITLPPRHGKQIASDTPVLTKNKGWIVHGDLCVGDYVFDTNGKPIKIKAVTEEYPQNMCVRFTDGSMIKCHENHEWEVYDRHMQKWRILETRQLVLYGCYKGDRARFQLRNVSSVQMDEKELTVEPYFLGAWLGDGKSNAPVICKNKKDLDIILSNTNYPLGARWIHKDTGVHYQNFLGVTKLLRDIGVLNNKHIPNEYFVSSEQQRRRLLAGLVDTDGCIEKVTGRIRYRSASFRLINDVKKLVVSLGYRASIDYTPANRQKRDIKSSESWCVQWTPHDSVGGGFLPRKKSFRIRTRRKIGIKSIERCEEHLGKCIQVDSEAGIYLVGENLLPTHNSILTTQAFTAWFLGRNPHKRIITASYGQDLATDFGAKTRDLVSTELYKAIFPNLTLKEDTQSKNKWATEQGGYYLSVGSGGSLTGRGTDILLYDDLIKNREESMSKIYRDKIWNWHTSTAYTRLEPNGAIILIMTRWHVDDIAGRLIEQGGWEVLHFPAIATSDEKHRKAGEALWHQRFDINALQAIKEAIGVQDWNSLYQGNPVLSENQEFKPEMFNRIEQNEFNLIKASVNIEYTITVDLAISQKESADKTAIVVLGKSRNKPEWYVVEIIADRLDPLQTIDALFMLYEKYRPIKIGIETTAYQKSMIYFMQEEMRRRQVYLPLQELKSSNSKEMRIRGLLPLYRAGIIFHINTPKARELEDELLLFPQSPHDDLSDAMAYQLQLIQNTTGNTKRVTYNE